MCITGPPDEQHVFTRHDDASRRGGKNGLKLKIASGQKLQGTSRRSSGDGGEALAIICDPGSESRLLILEGRRERGEER